MTDELIGRFLIHTLVPTTLLVSVTTVFLLLVSRVVQRPRIFHLLWVVVLLKFWLPLGIEVCQVDPGLGTRATVGPSELAVAGAVAQQAPVAAESPGESIRAGLRPSQLADPGTTRMPVDWWSWDSVNAAPSLFQILAWVWCIVSLVLFARTAMQTIRFQRLLKATTDAVSVEPRVTRLARTVDCRNVPRVRFMDAVIPPMLWAAWGRPTVILPRSWWQTLDSDARDLVLSHELIHLRRKDHWVCWLRTFTRHVFWWHPVVWIADREIDALAEQCCDAEVAFRFRGQRREYALTLLSVADWLSDGAPEQAPRSLAMQMARAGSRSFKSLQRRMTMMSNSKYQPWTSVRCGLAVAACFALLATSVGIAQKPDTVPPEGVDAASQRRDRDSAALTGRITDQDGKPISFAKVRCVFPPVDLRHPFDASKHQVHETKTDRGGHYGIVIDGLTESTKASLDVQARGYARLVGTFMMGGQPNDVTIQPGQKVTFDAELSPGLYFAGQVVDQAGKPIEGALVFSRLRMGGGTGGIEQSYSDDQGRFEIHGYQPAVMAAVAQRGAVDAMVAFQHPDYTDANLRNLEKVAQDERDKLTVTMTRGLTMTGQVLNEHGKPVRDVLVAVQSSVTGDRRGGRTDADGRFRLTGLARGQGQLRVVDVASRAKHISSVEVSDDVQDKTVQLQTIDQDVEPTVEVLGMRLTNVTGDVAQAFELPYQQGVMVVQAGDDHRRLKIGRVRPGSVFWMVGQQRVSNIKEMLDQLIEVADRVRPDRTGNESDGEQPSAGDPRGRRVVGDGLYVNDQVMIRVVYGFESANLVGTNTQYMRLTADDIEQIKAIAAKL